MGRHNIYLPEDLEDLASQLELSLSAVLQNAIREEAQRRGTFPAQMLQGPSKFRKEQGIGSQGISGDGITRGGGSGISRGWSSEREW